MPKKYDASITVRMPEPLRAALRQAAEAEELSVAAYIVRELTRATLDAEKRLRNHRRELQTLERMGKGLK